MQNTVVIDGGMAITIPASADCNLHVPQDGEIGEYTIVHSDNYYTGPVEVTPSAETQTLYTETLVMGSNITINPVPSNYGLITWDGSTLTVS